MENKETQMGSDKGIYYGDNHYFDISDLADALESDDELESIKDHIEVEETDLEPLMELDEWWITERVCDERMTEDGDEVEKLREVIKKHCNFAAINAEMPKLYYPNGKKYKITKQELLDAL